MKAFIFDFDGTIIDTGATSLDAFSYALKPFREAVTMEFIEEVRALPPHQIFSLLLSEPEQQIAFTRLKEYFLENFQAALIFEGIHECLEELRRKKKDIALWTGRDLDSTLHLLEHHDLTQFFSTVVSGSCVPTNKPDVAGLKKANLTLGHEPHELVMVGDHAHDIQAAHDYGAHAVLVKWQQSYQRGAFEKPPHREFESVTDFYRWIQNL